MNNFLKTTFFFFLGATISLIFIVTVGYLLFTTLYRNKVYPGVKIRGNNVSGLTEQEVERTLSTQYLGTLDSLTFAFSYPNATISATGKDLNLKPDINLMAKRAISIGRQTKNPYYNFSQIISAINGQINLPLEISMDTGSLDKLTAAIAPLIEKQPVDALYEFIPGAGPDQRGRVVSFRQSEDGRIIDKEKIQEDIIQFSKTSLNSTSLEKPLPIKIVSPNVKSTTADDLGLKNLIGRGESYFYDSIPGRVYNISLGTSKVNGSLIAPGEIFSFDEAIGTVSAVFGFQKAYSIVKGKTVLDDGGGVCQVSTTLYRAVLNAGLPVLERTAHSYRVGFYEQGGFLPGLDATVYPPNPDLKFKNDTGGWILIQSNFDTVSHKLTFDIFGTSDGRSVSITGPVIISASPPPDPIYEDDPTKAVGTVTQVDTAHYGARVYFKRLVTRLGTTLIDETVWSDYVPWPARFLKGTKT